MKYLEKFIYRFLLIFIILTVIPLQAVIGFSIFITTGFPILYRQWRVGKNGKKFLLYKFCTMVLNADVLKKKYKHLNEAHGPVFKIRNDPRFTPVGRFLSHTGLDELPQLWNVLRGDMALIGPRPLPVAEAKKLNAWQKKRHIIKPGIISPWILEGYHRQSFVSWMKRDVTYIKEKNWRIDTILLLRAVKLLSSLFVRELQRNPRSSYSIRTYSKKDLSK